MYYLTLISVRFFHSRFMVSSVMEIMSLNFLLVQHKYAHPRKLILKEWLLEREHWHFNSTLNSIKWCFSRFWKKHEKTLNSKEIKLKLQNKASQRVNNYLIKLYYHTWRFSYLLEMCLELSVLIWFILYLRYHISIHWIDEIDKKINIFNSLNSNCIWVQLNQISGQIFLRKFIIFFLLF